MKLYRDFQHETDIQVRFGDIDSMGHVNNAKYFTYIESARINYMNEVLGKSITPTKHSVILAKASMDFLVAIELGDQVKVFTRCPKIGNRSFDLDYEIVKVNDNDYLTVAKANTIMVAYDYESNQTIPVSDEWRKLLAEYEGKNFE